MNPSDLMIKKYYVILNANGDDKTDDKNKYLILLII